ncbi:hypothetical protein [Paraburkholderia youngii]|uniref:hypothetical protein n=1 Tax=Paraburkholderia youngii TaxID=2782701 RepID=UPI003D22874A
MATTRELPLRPKDKKPPRVHLATQGGGRSECRHSSRPSRTRVTARSVSLELFLQTPAELRCLECQRAADKAVQKANDEQQK